MRIYSFLKSNTLYILFTLFTTPVFSQCEESFQTLWGLTDGNSITANHANFNVQKDLLVCGLSSNRGIVVQYNGTSGIRWAKTFTAGSFVNLVKIIPMTSGGTAVAGYVKENNLLSLLVLRLNDMGNIVWSKRLHDVSAVPGLTLNDLAINGIAETPDGGITVVGRKIYRRPDGGSNNRIFIFQLGPAGNISWTREDTQGNEDEAFAVIVDQGSIVVAGSTYSVATGIKYGFIEKLNPADGTLSMHRLYQLNSSSSNYFRSIEKKSGGYELGTQAFVPGLRIYNKLLTNFNGDQLDCKLLPEMGPSLLDQFYYPVPLPDGSSILWKPQYYSAVDIELSKLNSNNIVDWNYQYTKPGKQSICNVLPVNNSQAIAVGSSPDPALSNGKDYITLLKIKSNGILEGCTNDPRPLTAKDSLNYIITSGTWQTTALNFQAPFDISLTSQNVLLAPTSLCQGTICSINSLSILGDTMICKQNAIVQYKVRISGSCRNPVQWTLSSPIGNIQPVNDSTIQIQYTQPGNAVLKAETSTSCSTYLQQVSVRYLPSSELLELGNDKSICMGSSVTLSVSNQFRYVQWMNGNTNNDITVTDNGLYSVIASEDGICFQQDTVRVIVNPLPVLNLPDDSLLCVPGNKILNAGNGFRDYLWQDGSTQSSFNIRGTGTYWLMITDFNDCKTSDTVQIKSLVQRPSGFAAFKDTAICFGEKVNLQVADNYAQYSWENGLSSAPVYPIDKPGIYTIHVMDGNGCAGTDSITVTDKKCTQALYVPTAFTPNKDGKNDLFKPIAIGMLDYLNFRVYNRWGEIVFQTNNITKGWDGVYRNQEQSTNTFVWMVEYRFAGSKTVQLQKGVVTMIK